jgi:hypothetical protein
MTDFENKIHSLLCAPRPKNGIQPEEEFRRLVSSLVQECEEDDFKWKRFTLALLYKRYHALAPEAKTCAKNISNTDSTPLTGRGERKLFYLAVEQLMAELDADNVVSPTTTDEDATMKNTPAIRKAVSVLVELAPYVGGTRDVCNILERAVESIVSSTTDGASLQLDGSLSLLVRDSVLKVEHAIQVYAAKYASLAALLDLAATRLDQDIQIIRATTSSTTTATGDNNSSPLEPFPSTMHIFIPHNRRGALSKAQKAKLGRATSLRQVVNASAEVLLWSRTSVAMQNPVFKTSLKRLLSHESTEKSIAKTSLHQIQTVIRNIRREMNSCARSQGFMLTDQFVHDPSKLNMSQIFKGKCGDLNKLQRFATKSGSRQVLRMVNHRFTSSQSKIVQYDSLSHFQRSWKVNTDPQDEVAQLEQQIQKSQLQKTLQVLRGGIIPKLTDRDKCRKQVIASLDVSPLNHLAAALLAAALSGWKVLDEGDDSMETSPACASTGDDQQDITPVKLLIGDSEYVMHSFDDFITLVDGIVSKTLITDINACTFMGEDGVATTKALLNILDRHLGKDSDLTLLTSANLSIPRDRHSDLVASGCRVHCHDADDIGNRLEREGAKAGDITVSLAWNTFDDLDLHVWLPSGEEISFMNRHACQGGIACLDVDMNAGGGQSEEAVENVFIGDLDEHIEAPQGKYKVVIQNYNYHTKDRSASIPWKLVVTMNGSKQTYTGECQGSGTGSDVVACEFEYTGRTAPFPGEEDKEKSAFEASDLINLTASTGQTLESITQLVRVHQQLALLDEARVIDDEHRDTTMTERSRPIEAEAGTLEVTSRDHTDMLLAGLPQKFQRTVAEAFGGISLAEACAKEIARRMIEGKVPLSELKRHGYPSEIVDAVKRALATGAAAMAE